jgi:hypothetical protein
MKSNEPIETAPSPVADDAGLPAMDESAAILFDQTIRLRGAVATPRRTNRPMVPA